MNGTQKRETFIALRARKQGYQIASEVLNPPLKVSPPTIRDPDHVYLEAVRSQRWAKRERLRMENRERREIMCLIAFGVIMMIGIGIVILAYQMARISRP